MLVQILLCSPSLKKLTKIIEDFYYYGNEKGVFVCGGWGVGMCVCGFPLSSEKKGSNPTLTLYGRIPAWQGKLCKLCKSVSWGELHCIKWNLCRDNCFFFLRDFHKYQQTEKPIKAIKYLHQFMVTYRSEKGLYRSVCSPHVQRIYLQVSSLQSWFLHLQTEPCIPEENGPKECTQWKN